jgi:hypothetical protein
VSAARGASGRATHLISPRLGNTVALRDVALWHSPTWRMSVVWFGIESKPDIGADFIGSLCLTHRRREKATHYRRTGFPPARGSEPIGERRS